MSTTELKDFISKCSTMLYFRYCGKEGHVDPYYMQPNHYEYLLWYDGNEKTVHSIDAVMSAPFFDGHSLAEIADKLTDIDW